MTTKTPVTEPQDTTAAPATVASMHVSLNAANLERTVAFYRAFLGAEPAKVRPDYAKFELQDPPLVLSLNAAPVPARHGHLSHLGLRVPTAEALEAARRRVKEAGVGVELEETGVSCCYAVQDKFWVRDPDGNPWEVYRFLADDEPTAPPQPNAGVPSAATGGCCTGPAGTCS